MDRLQRTELMLGKEKMNKLSEARVAVIGLGGVGGAAAEALVRGGICHMLFVDGDTVDESNLNRQLLATEDAVGLDKIAAAEKRFSLINPEGDFTYKKEFYLPENCDFLFDWKPDYIIDAIDTVTAKLDIAKKAKEKGIRLITCLGTGNRLDPEKLHIGDIADTVGCGCALARVMRRELKKRGITKLTVLYSTEEPLSAVAEAANGRHPPGSVSFVPPTAGYIIAGKCFRDIIGE